jgi:hypothetical protein
LNSAQKTPHSTGRQTIEPVQTNLSLRLTAVMRCVFCMGILLPVDGITGIADW